MDAPCNGVTGVVGAGIAIVALQVAEPLALPLTATVSRGANVAVVAITVVSYVDAALVGVATVISADVVVRTR